jgi:hypothetical protein
MIERIHTFDGAFRRASRHPDARDRTAPRPAAPVGAVLNPYAVYGEGEDMLRTKLQALSVGHLRKIIDAYGIAAPARGNRTTLTESIMSAVRSRPAA